MRRLLPVWLGLAVTVSAAGPWGALVQGLFDPATRDDAFAKIADAGLRERGVPPGKIEAKPVKEVVVCPEPGGDPMVAVFLKSSYDKSNAPARSGHFVLLSADGKFLPIFQNANSLGAKDIFEDINGDGVIDWVWSIDQMFQGGLVRRLEVIPVVRGQTPALTVLFKSSGFGWRMQKRGDAPGEIQIGKVSKKSFEPVASYRWSKAGEKWEGPEGGGGADFIRVHASTDPEAAAAELTVRPNRKREMEAPKFPDDFKMLGRNDGKLETDLGPASYIDVDAQKGDMSLGLRLFQPPLALWKLKSEKAMLDGARDNILAGPKAPVLEKETDIKLDGLNGRSFIFFDKAKSRVSRSDYLLNPPDLFIFSYDGPREGLELPGVRAFFESLRTVDPKDKKADR